jgi:hypothetical protein
MPVVRCWGSPGRRMPATTWSCCRRAQGARGRAVPPGQVPRRQARQQKATKLEDVFAQMGEEARRDAQHRHQGRCAGFRRGAADALTKLSNDEVKVNVMSSGVGGITESDANLALASNAIDDRLQCARRQRAPSAHRGKRPRPALLQHHLRRHRRGQGGRVRHAGAGDPGADRRRGRGARSVQLAEVRPGRRLPGRRGHGQAQQSDPRAARQRRDLRGRAGIPAPLQGRRPRSRPAPSAASA